MDVGLKSRKDTSHHGSRRHIESPQQGLPSGTQFRIFDCPSRRLVLTSRCQIETNFRVSFFFVLQGSDPRAATCRSKLQSKRAKLNQEINKELRLRAGAENLFK